MWSFVLFKKKTQLDELEINLDNSSEVARVILRNQGKNRVYICECSTDGFIWYEREIN